MRKQVLGAGLVTIAAVATISAVVASTATGSKSTRSSGQLVGAGATFPFPLISQWVKDYPSKTGVDTLKTKCQRAKATEATQSRFHIAASRA